MRKVTKILLRVISAIILLLIFLPLTISLLLALPIVQNLAIDKASSWASQKMGTRIEIGHITYGMLNRVAIRDFYVEDLDGDTLLYVRHLNAYLGSLATLPKSLTINLGNIDGGKFILRETTRGPMNVKEITDKIPRGDGKNPFRIDVRSLSAKDVDFRLHRIAKHKDEGVDYANMQILDIDTQIFDFAVDAGAVMGDISRITFHERSGFVLDDMTGHFLVDRGKIEVKDAHLKSAESDINLDYLLLDGDGWDKYKDFINNVPIHCDVVRSTVSSEDVGFFAPPMWAWDTTLRNSTLSMDGTVANFIGRVEHTTLEDGGTLSGSARVKGLINVPRTHFDIDIKKVDATTKEVARLLNNIARISLSDGVAAYVERATRLSANGTFKGYIHDFAASASAEIASGGAFEIACKMQNPAQGRKRVEASISASDANIKNILANKLFGTASFDATATAEFGNEEPILLISEGDIHHIDIYGHSYQDMGVRANIDGRRIEGSLDSKDEAFTTSAQGVADFTDKEMPKYDAVVNIERADLHALNINRRDTTSILSAKIDLSAVGPNIDNLNGSLRIAEAYYETIGRECEADLLQLDIISNEDARTLSLKSDFVDAEFESRTAYKDVLFYAKSLLVRYAPLLYNETTRLSINREVLSLGSEHAILSLRTKDLDPLLSCINEGMEMAPDSKIEMLINPSENRFLMRASSDCIAMKNYLATNIDVRANNNNDSLSMRLHALDLYAGVAHFSGVGLKAGAKSNKISVEAIFADSIRDLQGELSATARISQIESARRISVDLNPTYIRSGDSEWGITTDGIDIDSTRIAIRNLSMRNNLQELYINGVASRNVSDSLHIKLTDFSIAPLTQLTNRLGYQLNGITNGFATVSSALKDTRIEARIDVDKIDINGIKTPNILLTSNWDFGRSRASLDISTRDDNKTVVKGYYAPSQARYYGRIQTDSVKMKLLDPILKGVISNTDGTAKVDLTLVGEQRFAELKGKIEVENLATTVDYTACRYTAPKATIEVNNNRLTAAETPIFDKNGNQGTMTLDVSLQHLSNIEYNVGLQVNNMQVLDTSERDNPMFYGSIFASGTGSIRGDKAGVQMDFVARSEDNSKFFMPLTDKSDIKSANFVTFASKEVDTTSYLMRKKLLFESRQKKRSVGGGSMDITMALDVRPNAEVQLVIDPTVGDIIKGNGEGMLNLRINPQANIFEMYGDYTIAKGSYLFTLQNVINKWFDIEPGSTIQWTGEPLNALLNINAVYRLKASLQPLLQGSLSQSNKSYSRSVPVECFIHLTDRLTQPSVNFDIIVPNVDSEVQSIIASTLATPESKSQQFLYLILANSFVSESSNTGMGINATATAATTGFEMLSNQLSNWLSGDNYKIILRYRPRTAQLSDEVNFGFSKGLINNRLILEVEGNYIVDKSQMVNSSSNFKGEAYLTWLIDRAGTLRLKGFTHTIDRFDENQGLQETGLGIYFKEDFDNKRDLQRRLQARFKRDKSKVKANKTDKAEKSAKTDNTEKIIKTKEQNKN